MVPDRDLSSGFVRDAGVRWRWWDGVKGRVGRGRV